MTEFTREFFKTDPILHKLYMIIKQKHVVANHTQDTLYKNRKIKDFCEVARHFVMMPGKTTLHIYYDVTSWWLEPNGIQLRIEFIGVYDDFMEYEIARMKGLHSGKKADIPNIN